MLMKYLNLENINFEKLKSKLVFFKQQMMYYKFNLILILHGLVSRACKKKNLISPQWLRNIKEKILSLVALRYIIFHN